MSRFEEALKTRMDAMISGTSIERMTDDDDVRQWLRMGRLAMIFCIWAAMLMAVALVISFRF